MGNAQGGTKRLARGMGSLLCRGEWAQPHMESVMPVIVLFLQTNLIERMGGELSINCFALMDKEHQNQLRSEPDG